MYEVIRVYKNSDTDILRTDTITMMPTPTSSFIGRILKLSNITTSDKRTYYREIKTEGYYESPADRTVASIQIVTNANSLDYNVSAPANYTWVEWTVPGIRCNMSDLPQIGDDV